MRNITGHRAWRSARVASWALLSAVGLSACDFKVTNPGPVEDAFLAQQPAHAGIVNGAGRDLSDALNWISYTGAAVTRELHPAGSTGSFGINVRWQVGMLEADDTDLNTHWMRAQRARWTAEDGARRLKAALGDADFNKSPQAAQILIWAGFANRLLGENMCQAVIDGGPAQPHTEYLKRAEAHFTQAMQIAQAANQPNLVTAARAGRASVRVHLGNWAGAVEDAAGVPTTFRFVMPYFDNDLDLYNRIHEAGRSQPYRAHTVWATVNEDYFRTTRDPRVPYEVGTGAQERGDGAVNPIGRVLFYRQLKHNQRNSPINLVTGREMRLIEAEARLRSGDVTGAVGIINQLRSSLNVATVPQVTASNAADAWTALKRERGIELWLEARRLGDLRRWKEGNTPGALDPLETVGNPRGLPLRRQDLCFPISQAERQTNPNFGT